MRAPTGLPSVLFAAVAWLTACGPARRPAPPPSRDAIACAHGDVHACEAAGYALTRRSGHSSPQSLALLVRACDGGVATACPSVVALLAFGRDVPRDVPRARDLADRECTRGHQDVCVTLALLLISGAGIAHDPDRAYWLFRRSCEAGVEGGCEGLVAMRTVLPGGGAADVRGDEAFAVVERACGNDVMAACATLGMLYVLGRGVTYDPPHGLGLLSQACDGHNEQACANLALLTLAGAPNPPSPADTAHAMELLRHACDTSIPGACGTLGGVYAFLDVGVPRDDARAFALFRRGCDGGDPGSCNSLAQMYLLGRGVARDEVRGVQLLQRYCDATVRQSCTSLGRATQRQLGGLVRDDARSAHLAELGCDGGDKDGCEDLARYYESGTGVPRDAARARALREQLCAAGRASSCPPPGDAGVADDASAAAITGSPTIR